MLKVNRLKNVSLLICLAFLVYYFGLLTHLFEIEFEGNFHYPYEGDIEKFVQEMRNNITPNTPPINSYFFKFRKPCVDKCQNVLNLRLVFLIKSASKNWERRIAIRDSWGFEERFPDVKIRTLFLIGESHNEKLQKRIKEESEIFKDLVQANFNDNYYNNTLKTIMGFTWGLKFCPNSKFYVFVDDDYYVSTKNLLEFLRNPFSYPNFGSTNERQLNFDSNQNVRLFAGHVSKSASPQRSHDSKWYISLDEYPYNLWPSFINAGAYVLSKEALLDMYYATFYTKHFRFDDIYVGFLAHKSKIRPFHCEQFFREKLTYNPEDYRYVIASHGYEDQKELMKVWTEQRKKGFA